MWVICQWVLGTHRGQEWGWAWIFTYNGAYNEVLDIPGFARREHESKLTLRFHCIVSLFRNDTIYLRQYTNTPI